MIDLKDIQQKAVDLISAHAYFTGKTVLLDDGTVKDEIEEALRAGFCVSVDVPIDASVLAEVPGVAETYVMFPVYVQINPAVNVALETPLSITEAVQEIFAALLAFDGTDGQSADRFEVMPKPFELVANDPGLLAYACWFKKQIVLS